MAQDGCPSLGGHTTSVCNQPPKPTQPSTLSGTVDEYRPMCDDAMRLGMFSGVIVLGARGRNNDVRPRLPPKVVT